MTYATITDHLKTLQNQLREINRSHPSLCLKKIKDNQAFDLTQLDTLTAPPTAKSKAKPQLNSFSSRLLNDLINTNSALILSNRHTSPEAAHLSAKLTRLSKEANQRSDQLGLSQLHIGYPFLRGTFANGNALQCPLLLIPVNLTRKKDGESGWYLDRDTDEPIRLNAILLKALEQYNQQRIEATIEDALIPLLSTPSLLLEQIASILQHYAIPCQPILTPAAPISNQGIAPTGPRLRSTDTTPEPPPEAFFPTLPFIELPPSPSAKPLAPSPMELYPFPLLGLFPQTNDEILKDLDEITKKVPQIGLVGTLLPFIDEADDAPLETIDPGRCPALDLDSLPTEANMHVYPVDASQEEVIYALSQPDLRGLVVKGPPGTGKSQLIINLIANALGKGEKVLVVCQKRTALEVILERLQTLQLDGPTLLISDPNKDRKSFYRQIERLLSADFHHTLDDNHTAYQKLAKQVDDHTQDLKNIHDALHSPRPWGIPAYQLYRNSNKFEDPRTFLALTDMADQVTSEAMEEIAAKMEKLGQLHSRFGHHHYPLFHRHSFQDGTLQNRERYRALLATAMEQWQSIATLSQTFQVPPSPETCWKFEKALRHQLSQQSTRPFFGSFLNYLRDFSHRRSLHPWLATIKLTASNAANLPTIDDSAKKVQNILEYTNATQQFHATVDSLTEFLQPQALQPFREALITGNIEGIQKRLQAIASALTTDYDDLCQMDSAIHRLNPLEQRLLALLQKQLPPQPGENIAERWEEAIRQSFYHAWIDCAETTHPKLKEFHTEDIDDLPQKCKRLLDEKQKLTPKALQSRWGNRIQQTFEAHPALKGQLRSSIIGKAKKQSIRRWIENFNNPKNTKANHTQALLELLPIWLLSPSAVSSILPMEKELFDLVIFDEASQCPLSHSIPAIYRAKKVVVVGDEYQLPPSTGFVTQDDDDDSEDTSPPESLLHQALKFYDTKMLKWHYRSTHADLINFSNYAFYRGQLQTLSHARSHRIKPIEWYQVDGQWRDNANHEEAEKVCDLLAHLASSSHHHGSATYPTVGIITFNAKQSNLIMKKIDARKEKDFAFRSQVEAMETNPAGPLFVKNIENVQGDEREIIIISVGYGRNEEDRFIQRYGTINEPGGERYLNVAITRAKDKIFVLCSMPLVMPNNCKNEGPKLFIYYLQYAKAVSDGDRERVDQILHQLNDALRTKFQEKDKHFDSIFEEQVYACLQKRNYQLDTQVKCAGYRIDLSIVHPHDPTRYLLAIECDGATYHSAPSARERDIYRHNFLESRGWKIHRIWSRNWWKDRNSEIEKIERAVAEELRRNP
ncbi:AAA domain-containing protein [Heliophilum fasciatum]|uniref:AAA domain-containing protein n=1 Tax=Heliophilum fasciatum TaxID=35700 RepID=A0A4R2SC57_9FIRM|nr:AAA domain-containing protein [Heliophilum fasciatum]MCW2276784.1 very-short-patch-repair endonuclease [Heliophilum fasciatum]TCP68755.1 AAA domain-containing protein [Heliophilum fasciatum]